MSTGHHHPMVIPFATAIAAVALAFLLSLLFA